MELNNECYTYKKHTYTDGLFQNIDATYIIHLEGNGRIETINKQLEEYHPTNTVYIVFNKGFKKCKKSLKVQNSMYDIVDANLEVFKHSKMNNYSNILILEDDFIFNENIKLDVHRNNIDTFLKNNDDKQFIYHLGALPFIVMPYNSYTYTSICCALHASVFTTKARDYILNYSMNNYISDWDFFILEHIWRYIYYVPLCYQTFPETENKANWYQPQILRYVANNYISYTKFDTQPEPGTSYMYNSAKGFSFIFFIVICYIIYWLLSYFKAFKAINKVFKSYRFKL